MDNLRDKNSIEQYIKEFAIDTFGVNFEFRKHQKETCVSVVYNILNGERPNNTIIQAPTGSGKSITAMVIAGVLNKYFGMTGYILISDLSLLDQYIKDVDRYLPDWGYIKGQDNYSCLRNGMDYRFGQCHMVDGLKKITDIMQIYDDCSPSCAYIQDRIKAAKAGVTLCTYHHFLSHQNIIYKSGMYAFDCRNFVICDEAHKIVDIVQQMYSLTVGERTIKLLRTIAQQVGVDENDTDLLLIENSINDLLKSPEESKVIIEKVSHIEKLISLFDSRIHPIVKEMTNGKSKAALSLSFKYGQIKDIIEELSTFTTSAKNADDIVFTLSQNGKTVTLNRLNEDILMKKYFHPHYNYGVFMSATIGDPKEFSNNASLKDYEFIDIPSTFDFTYSKIFFIPGYKMSMAHKSDSLPIISEMVSDILSMYKGRRGCILVSSYNMAKEIKALLPEEQQKRVLLYENSREKIDVLNRYKYGTNEYVIIGPSLFDGISLDDDLCRFIIIAKIPYPDLSNKFCSKKKDKNPTWYSSQAALSIIQGVGRGVRSETDWCQTFILDDCFQMLYHMSANTFSKDFKMRIQKITKESLKSTDK
jgi:Rad3-related DNA helicase